MTLSLLATSFQDDASIDAVEGPTGDELAGVGYSAFLILEIGLLPAMFTLATGTPFCPVGNATSIKSSSSSSNFTTVLDFLSTALATGDDGSTASLIGTSSSLNAGRSSSSTYVFLAGGVSGMYESDSFVRLVFVAGLFSEIGGDRTRVFLRVSVFTGRMRVADRLVAFVSISPSRSSIKSTSAALTVGLKSSVSMCSAITNCDPLPLVWVPSQHFSH